MRNLLYTGEPPKWEELSLIEQLEEIRKDCCTGPCGQSQSTLTRRDRINRALRAAMEQLTPPSNDQTLGPATTESPVERVG